jgi:hypothetical protein
MVGEVFKSLNTNERSKPSLSCPIHFYPQVLVIEIVPPNWVIRIRGGRARGRQHILSM